MFFAIGFKKRVKKRMFMQKGTAWEMIISPKPFLVIRYPCYIFSTHCHNPNGISGKPLDKRMLPS